jgi:hypothetical protein
MGDRRASFIQDEELDPHVRGATPVPRRGTLKLGEEQRRSDGQCEERPDAEAKAAHYSALIHGCG